MIASQLDLDASGRSRPTADDGPRAAASPADIKTVLVVDDEPIVRDVLASYLDLAGYRTLQAGDGNRACDVIEHEAPSLVILDVLMPDVDGLELCRWIRSRSDVPVIILSARGEETDRIVGLELGADDYVVKPFSPREIVCRVRTVLRRTEPRIVPVDHLSFDGLEIDVATHVVMKEGTSVSLTPREFDLLYFLARHPRHVFSRELLMDRIWGYHGAVDTGTVTVHIRRLREKIESDPAKPELLQTVWGVGYRFAP